MSEKPVLVDFGAEWCQPCKALKPTLEALSGERTDINFAFADIDDSDQLARDYHIMSVPTLAIFKDGKMLNRIVGNAPRATLEKFINENVA